MLLPIVALIFTSCSGASDSPENINKSERCGINFTSRQPSIFSGVSVTRYTSAVEVDEKSLQTLEVVSKGSNLSLEITSDTSLIDGDKEYISIADINFDDIPDIPDIAIYDIICCCKSLPGLLGI